MFFHSLPADKEEIFLEDTGGWLAVFAVLAALQLLVAKEIWGQGTAGLADRLRLGVRIRSGACDASNFITRSV
jgi:hypothetical protein